MTWYGDLGSLWSSSLHKKLAISPNGVSIQALRGDGSVASFAGSGATWTAPQDIKDTLSVTGSNYVYRDQSAQALEVYDNGSAVAKLGQLQSITQSSGMKLVAIHSTGSTPTTVAPAPGYLLSLTDPFGRSLSFTYNTVTTAGGSSNVVIKQITNALGQTIVAGYDGNANLTGLTWQDGKTKTFVYDSPHANQAWALTGVIDENTKRYATFTYDAAGWAKSTMLNGGVYAYEASYTSAPQPVIREVFDSASNVLWRYHEWAAPVGAFVSQPNGSPLGMNFTTVAGTGTGASQANLLRFSGYSQPAGAGCSASTSNQEYDDRGNVKLYDDFNGHRTCFAHDPSRNLETARVEGLANTATCSTVTGSGATLPTGSRKISTQWHPDWAIKTKQAEPKKLTTWVYNGQPDPFNGNQLASCTSASYGATSVANLPDGKPIVVLCKEVVQATLDATGAQGLSPTLDNLDATAAWQSTTSHTYNQYGQMLTSVDANNRTTTYAYYQSTAFTGTDPNAVGHYQGDLEKVTNAKGHITQYTSYDKAGRVLTMVDPNQATTTYSYTPRGWLSTVNQAGQLTSYDYWPTGLLKKVTSPDSSTLSYTYDDAHRLTDVTDHLGNTVHYTLDNAGNRIGEDVKDTSTALTRNISRVYDALNRLQTVTGAAQ